MLAVIMLTSCGYPHHETELDKKHERFSKEYKKLVVKEAKLVMAVKHLETMNLWKKCNKKIIDASGDSAAVRRLATTADSKVDSVFELLDDNIRRITGLKKD
jgi:hypothetical protein